MVTVLNISVSARGLTGALKWGTSAPRDMQAGGARGCASAPTPAAPPRTPTPARRGRCTSRRAGRPTRRSARAAACPRRTSWSRSAPCPHPPARSAQRRLAPITRLVVTVDAHAAFNTYWPLYISQLRPHTGAGMWPMRCMTQNDVNLQFTLQCHASCSLMQDLRNTRPRPCCMNKAPPSVQPTASVSRPPYCHASRACNCWSALPRRGMRAHVESMALVELERGREVLWRR
jgi:hypothetical protein